MKPFLLLAAFFIATTAQARPNTQNYTTQQVKDLVAKHGSIVLSTSSFGYDRFVAKPSLCRGEKAVPAYVPTIDSDTGFIGYACVSQSSEGTISSKRYPRNPYVCKEGQRRLSQESSPSSYDGQETVERICSNGKWRRAGVEPVGPKITACQEGVYGIADDTAATTVCRGGEWRKLN